MRLQFEIILFFALQTLFPAAALAHPMLDRAVNAYEMANFDLALRTFDTASRNADLTVEELLELFEMRALVHHALGDEVSMRADLRRLVSVRGSYRLGRLAPPPVRSAFEEMREAHRLEGAVELRIEETQIDGSPWMVARLLRVPEGLVDHTTLQCNVANGSRTVSRTSQGTNASVKLPDSGVHNGCSATARTRQGGVLFSAHVEGAQPLLALRSVDRFQMSRRDNPRSDRARHKKKWPWIVAASAVVIAGGITAGVVISQRSKGSNGADVGAVTVNW